MQSVELGDFADPTYRNQTNQALGENYLLDGGGVSNGESSTSIVTRLEESVLRFGNEVVVADQQTVTHPDGDTNYPRVDALTIDSNGNYGRVTGTPDEADPPDMRPPRTRSPVAPSLADQDVVCVAWLWVPAGTDSSEQVYNDWIIDRRVSGAGLNQLDLIPGRDLQYILDNAREGETLRGDRSQVIELDQPLTLSVPNVTIEGLNLRYADGAATSTADDMLTLAAEAVTVRGVTLDGNKQNQPASADGITVQPDADNSTIEDVDATNIGGFAVNNNGGYNSSFAVVDATISDVRAMNPGGGAVVVQGRSYRTNVSNVKCDAPEAGGGAVLVRSGPVGTTIEGAYCRLGHHVLELGDFGTTEDSLPVVNVAADKLVADGTPQLVANDLSSALSHSKIHISNARLRNYPTGYATSAIDLSYTDSSSVTDSSLAGFADGSGIRGNEANTLRISGVTLSEPNAPNSSGIFVTNGNNLTITNNTIRADGGLAVGIYVTSDGYPVSRAKILGNTIYRMNGNPAIQLKESVYNASDEIIDAVHVKNNTAATIDNGASGANVLISDNL